MAIAQRIAEDPRLIVWIELLTVAHLTGDARPVPRPGTLDVAADDIPGRVRRHAMAQLAGAAARSRSRHLGGWYSPEALAAHVGGLADELLSSGRKPCRPRTEVEWQAGCFRWVDVLDQLDRWPGSPDSPHPATVDWQRRGLRVPNAALAAQRSAVLEDASLTIPVAPLLYGESRPSALVVAVRRLGGSFEDSDRLDRTLSFLDLGMDIDTSWPRRRFIE